MKMIVNRIRASMAASNLLSELQEEHGALILHFSGGCCDGSQLMCIPEKEFMLGSVDVCLGRINKVPIYMAKDQFEYLQYNQLIVDAIPGKGGSFSLETARDMQFVTRYKMVPLNENTELSPITLV